VTSDHHSSSEREPLAGLVERVTFHNPDNGFCVLRARVRGQRELVTVLGETPSVCAGEYIQASGRWETHLDHGRQFRATFLRVTPPTSAEGMEKYLGSGFIKGIGPVFAQRLVSAFSETVFDVIQHDPRRLLEVEGIGPKRAERITASWADQRIIREIMAFLQSHGVSTSRAVRIYKTYGADAIPGERESLLPCTRHRGHRFQVCRPDCPTTRYLPDLDNPRTGRP
jgi:exodeoxyribonuclease V alpha subunit